MSRQEMTANSSNLSTIQDQDEQQEIHSKKQWFIDTNKQSILERYQFANKIGEGGFGQVFKAILIGTDLVRAIKVIRKDNIDEPTQLFNEIQLMKGLDHPNIVKLYQTYETDKEIYLVMEYCEGGELFRRVQKGKKMSESQAKEAFRDIAQATAYLHSRNVCHRDLKSQNFLFLDKKPGSILKLTDFGLSTTVPAQNVLKSMVGTIYYMSPEVIQRNYDISCDVWSMGIVLTVLLSGSAPFAGEQDSEIMGNILQKNTIIPEGISAAAKDLISRCLMPPEERIKASEILDHEWLIDIQRKQTICQMDASKNSQTNRFKKLALSIIESESKQKNVEELTKLLKNLDLNNDNQHSHLCRDQWLQMIKEIDKNGDVVLSSDQFVGLFQR